MTCTRVAVRGVVYESIGECAEILGVHRTTITRHLNAGTVDSIGLIPGRVTKPCEFDGVQYPSLMTAATAMGLRIKKVRQMVMNREKHEAQ